MEMLDANANNMWNRVKHMHKFKCASHTQTEINFENANVMKTHRQKKTSDI